MDNWISQSIENIIYGKDYNKMKYWEEWEQAENSETIQDEEITISRTSYKTQHITTTTDGKIEGRRSHGRSRTTWITVFYAETRPLVLWEKIWTDADCCVDGSGRVKKTYVSRSPVRRTAESALQSALHVMLLSYYIGMCVFHERQRDLCHRRACSQGFAKAVHMSNDRQHFDLA